jgi:hypothetical protein
MFFRKIFFATFSAIIICGAIFGAAPHAQAAANAGFIDTSIWFSNEPDTAGETVAVSTLINNQDPKAVYGLVGFYDNGKLLSRKTTTVEPHASKVVTINWKVTVGKHSMVAKFESTQVENDEGEEVEVVKNETEPITFTVKEAIPAKTDEKEKEVGADPNKSDIANTVDEAKSAATGAFGKVDEFREETAATYAEKAEAQQKSIADAKKAKDEKIEGKVAGVSATNIQTGNKIKETLIKTPFEYVKLYFFKFVQFVFAHKYIFYGLIILILFLIFRYMARSPR